MRNAAFCITGLALQGLSMSLMAQTDKPNIVIIMTDQQRADLCGREGFPLAVTPYVDQLAQENVWFNKAYTSTGQFSCPLLHVHRTFSFGNPCTYQPQHSGYLF